MLCTFSGKGRSRNDRSCRVLLFMAAALFILIPPRLHAAPFSNPITGHVTDSAGAPLAGVTISIRGKAKSATVTDRDGVFKLEASPGDILIISSTGYETKEVKYDN